MQKKLPDIHTDGWVELTKRVVELAVADYRMCLRSLRKRPDDKEIVAQVRNLEDFLRDGWYHCLLNIDGDALIKHLREEAQV